MMRYRGSKGSGYSKVARQRGFIEGRKAALDRGWKPFTKMTSEQHKAFKTAYHDALE